MIASGCLERVRVPAGEDHEVGHHRIEMRLHGAPSRLCVVPAKRSRDGAMLAQRRGPALRRQEQA